MRITGVGWSRRLAPMCAIVACFIASGLVNAGMVPVGISSVSGVDLTSNPTIAGTNSSTVGVGKFSSTIKNDFYVSFTLDVTNANIGRNDFLTLWFNDSPTFEMNTPSLGIKGNEDSAIGVNDLAVRLKMSDTQYPNYDFDDASGVSPIVTLVGKLSKSGGTLYDTFELWVLQSLDNTLIPLETLIAMTDPSMPDAVAEMASGPYSLEEIKYVGLRTANLDGSSDTIQLSNLQVSAVPEPTMLALWGLGGVAGLAYSMRKRKLANA